jgi:outer membrane protein OmpA-like peptidoglycan-associated protein
MKFRYKLLLIAAIVPMILGAQTRKWDDYRAGNGISLPTWGIKTNLLADLTASINLGVEFRTGAHTSLDITGQWNPFSFRDGVTKWKHIGAQPEFRYWLSETFRGHFFGVHAHYAFYNVGGLPEGIFSKYMHDNRFEGSLYGAGVSWGHRWNFSRRWGLEVTAGVGYAYKDYKRYDCAKCGEELGHKTKSYFGPTGLGVNLIFGGGKKKAAPVVAPVAGPVVKSHEPRFVPSFIAPVAEAVKVRDESGSAYLEYPVGSSVLNPDFNNNASELSRIDAMVESVKNDPDATIKGISLIGYASPEGSHLSNMSLSQRRAQALADYLDKRYGFPAGLISVGGGGEDWPTLSRLVGQSNIPGKQAMMAIIDGSDNFDARDRKMIAANSAGYDAMVRDIYPRLRRTDYKLDYNVAPVSVEKGKQLVATNPRKLSLDELYRIAGTYGAGSKEFGDAMEVAARTYPDSDVANSNAAAAAISSGNAASAASYLDKVKNRGAEWNNNMGIVSYMQGDTAKAGEYFRAAGSAGSANAAEFQKYLESVR